MNGEPDALNVDAHSHEQADDEADDSLDWDLDERDRYMAAHNDFEEDTEIDVLVRSDE